MPIWLILFLFLRRGRGHFKSGVLKAVNFSFDSVRFKNTILKTVFDKHKKYRLQIIYTQIKRDVNGKPSFKKYDWNLSKRKNTTMFKH